MLHQSSMHVQGGGLQPRTQLAIACPRAWSHMLTDGIHKPSISLMAQKACMCMHVCHGRPPLATQLPTPDMYYSTILAMYLSIYMQIRLMNISLWQGHGTIQLPRNIYWELLCSNFPGKRSLIHLRLVLATPNYNITPSACILISIGMHRIDTIKFYFTVCTHSSLYAIPIVCILQGSVCSNEHIVQQHLCECRCVWGGEGEEVEGKGWRGRGGEGRGGEGRGEICRGHMCTTPWTP